MRTLFFNSNLSADSVRFLKTCITPLSSRQLPHGWQTIPCSAHAWVARMENPPSELGQTLYFKIYFNRNRWESVKALLKGSRSTRAHKHSDLLRKNGFNAPTTFAWGKINQHIFLISEGMAGEGLADYMYRYWQRPLTRQQILHKRHIIKELALHIAELHNLGLIHGDLRPNNLLIHTENNSTSFSFIDNERNYLYRHRPPIRKIVKNLVQLNMIFPVVLTRTDRLRFFQCYAEKRQLSFSQRKLILNRVLFITQKRMRHKQLPNFPIQQG